MTDSGSPFNVVESEHITRDHITTLRFDHHDEGVWLGTASGWVWQLGVPGLHRASSAPLHAEPVIDARSWSSSFLSLSVREILAHSSGGAIQQCIRAPQDDTFACMELYRGGSQIITGFGQSSGVGNFDLASARPLEPWKYQGKPVVALRGPLTGGTFLAASSDGQIALLDGHARSLRPSSVLPAHRAGFEALDAAGNLIATAGYALVGAQPSLERQIKVFDVRMVPRLLCMLPFGAGPSLLRFHPRLSSTLVVASTSGSAMAMDAQGLGAGAPLALDLPPGAGSITALDISPTGELVAAATSGGWVQVLAAGGAAAPSVAGGVAPLEPPADRNPPALVPLTDRDPLSGAPRFLNAEGARLVSALAREEQASTGLPPRVLDPALAQRLSWSDGVGVAPNAAFDPGQRPGTATAASACLRALRAAPGGQRSDAGARARRHSSPAPAGRGARCPPRLQRYRKVLVAVHQAAQQSGPFYQDFDHARYNRAPPLLGLENDLANAYANPLIQALFFVPRLRAALLARVPDPKDEFGLADELGLLFRMLQTEGAVVCRAANLLRALRQSPKALALGLVEGVSGQLGAHDTEVETTVDRSLTRRIQSLSRFLLETLHRSLDAEGPDGASAGPVLDAFGMRVLTEMRCAGAGRGRPGGAAPRVQTKRGLVFQLELGPAAQAGPDLAGALQAALSNSSTIRAWFDAEVQYTTVQQRRLVATLPEVMLVACGHAAGDQGRAPAPRPARAVGVAFSSAAGALAVTQADSIEALERGFLSASPDARAERAELYELTAVVSHVRDPDEAPGPGGRPPEGHLVAEIRVPAELRTVSAALAAPAAGPSPADARAAADALSALALGAAAAAAPAPEPDVAKDEDWILFNDFRVEPVPWTDVASDVDGHKSTCLLLFTKRKVLTLAGADGARAAAITRPCGFAGPIPDCFRPAPVLTPDNFLRLCRLPSLGARVGAHPPSFVPLAANELPRPGMLVGLDAEFVSYSPPQYSTVGGLECITLPSRLGLARVSVVRGWGGPLAGRACIDDYICGREAVHDHLTRWSGIVAGDLTPNQSPHYLCTMKRSYLKLRHLIDCGVTFVGHGLKQDFRMINILIPPAQIVDTVRLFHRPHKRQLSLRFLASWVLRLNIQGNNHDSIEDASAALALYKVYLDLEEKGALQSVLDAMYAWGKTHGWEPVIWKDDTPHPAPMPAVDMR